MREDHCGDVVVVQLQIFLVIKESVCQSPSSRDGYWSEERLASHVPQGVEAGDVGVLVVVNQDVPGLVQVEADVLTAESVSVGSSAHGPEEDVGGGQLLSRVELDEDAVTGPLHLLNLNIPLDLHAALLNLASYGLAYLIGV